MHENTGAHGSEALDVPGPGVAGNCESLSAGAGNQNWGLLC